MRKLIVSGIVALSAGITLVGCGDPDMVTLESPHGMTAKVPAGTMVECAEEEYFQPVPCVWNSATRGNEEGNSFVVLGQGEGQVMMSITDNEARELTQ